VQLGGESVYSKAATGRFPEPGEVIAALELRLAG